MRITSRQLRQIIREELMRESDNGSGFNIMGPMAEKLKSGAQDFLGTRSTFSVYVPYTDETALDAKAMLGPPRDGSVTTVWSIDRNLQAKINRIENLYGSITVIGATGPDVSHTTRPLDLAAHANRLLGPPQPGREESRKAALYKLLGPELSVDSKAMFLIADATKGGRGSAPDGVKSIFIRSSPNL